MYWFLFSTITCFGCTFQPSSGRYKFTKAVKRGEACPYKHWCKKCYYYKIVITIVQKNGRITLKF